MTSTRPFHMNDLLRFNNVNLDVLTETFNMPFYLQYMSKWPEMFTVAEAPDRSIMGYMLGKSEGSGKLWHGHVSAVTVAPGALDVSKSRVDAADVSIGGAVGDVVYFSVYPADAHGNLVSAADAAAPAPHPRGRRGHVRHL